MTKLNDKIYDYANIEVNRSVQVEAYAGFNISIAEGAVFELNASFSLMRLVEPPSEVKAAFRFLYVRNYI